MEREKWRESKMKGEMEREKESVRERQRQGHICGNMDKRKKDGQIHRETKTNRESVCERDRATTDRKREKV